MKSRRTVMEALWAESVSHELIHAIATVTPLKYKYFETLAKVRELAQVRTWHARVGHVSGSPR